MIDNCSVDNALTLHHNFSIHPISHKQIRIPRAVVISVAGKNDLLSIGRKHGDGIEHTIIRNLF
jgi:hypothetical protein